MKEPMVSHLMQTHEHKCRGRLSITPAQDLNRHRLKLGNKRLIYKARLPFKSEQATHSLSTSSTIQTFSPSPVADKHVRLLARGPRPAVSHWDGDPDLQLRPCFASPRFLRQLRYSDDIHVRNVNLLSRNQAYFHAHHLQPLGPIRSHLFIPY